jgi:hypothetical protein
MILHPRAYHENGYEKGNFKFGDVLPSTRSLCGYSNILNHGLANDTGINDDYKINETMERPSFSYWSIWT